MTRRAGLLWLALAAALASLPPPALAAPGALDVGFGKAGSVVTSFPNATASADAVLVLPDGKLLAVGDASGIGPEGLALARYLADGSLDPSFGYRGRALVAIGPTSEFAEAAAALQPDGRIVVATTPRGGDRFLLARLQPDGSLDPTFGTDGTASIPIARSADASDVALQPDGKILVSGQVIFRGARYGLGIARVHGDGRIDATFDGDGRRVVILAPRVSLVTPVRIALQPDGKIVLAGTEEMIVRSFHLYTDVAVVRLDANGALDPSFGGDGRVRTDVGADAVGDVALQPDGKIVVAGTGFSNGPLTSGLVRYNPDGTLDASFGGDGKVLVAGPESHHRLALQPDGKIVLAGTFANTFAVARLNRDGTRDTGFDTAGWAWTDVARRSWYDEVHDAVLQPDGRIVVAGVTRPSTSRGFRLTRFALVRYRGGEEESVVPSVTVLRGAPGRPSACPRQAPCVQRETARTVLRGRIRPVPADTAASFVLLTFDYYDERDGHWVGFLKSGLLVPLDAAARYRVDFRPRAFARGLWRVRAMTPATATTKRAWSRYLFLRVRAVSSAESRSRARGRSDP